MPTAPEAGQSRAPARDLLVRSRLLDPLVDPDGPRLAIVTAPAGSGKTTLLRQVAERSSVPAARYQARPEDGAEAALVRGVGHALDGLHVAHASAARTVDELLEAVRSRSAAPLLLLMDDLHELTGTDAEDALHRLVRGWPPDHRLVLGCRRSPLSEMPALRLSPDVLEVDAEDLRFRSWEVQELFDVVYHQALPPESAAALARRTGGWAAGLTLFHLATTQHSPAQLRSAVDHLVAGSRLVRSYLTHNVLRNLPEDRRWFLLRTCPLGVLTGPLCDELLGTTRSLSVLEELVEDQLFTIPSDDGLTFRYHHVLQSHLEVALLEELGPSAARRWYARCAELLEGAGLVGEALRAYARAEDWEAVRRLLQEKGNARGGPAGAPPWHDLLPSSLSARDPWFVAADARRRLRRGDLGSAAQQLRRATELSDEPAFQDSCRAERGLIDAWRTSIRSAPGTATAGSVARAHWSARLRAAVRCAPGETTPPRSATPGDALADGLGLLLAGRPAEALPRLEAGLGSPDTADDGWLDQALALAALVAELLSPSRHPGLRDRLESTLLWADLDDHPWLARQARALLPLVLEGHGRAGGGVHDALLAECARADDAWGAALIQLIAGAGPAVLGCDPEDGTPAVERLQDAADRLRELDAPVLEVWARCARAVLLLREEHPAAQDAARRVEAGARACRLPAAGAVVRAASVPAPTGGRRAGAAPAPAAAGTLTPAVAVLTCFGGFRLGILPDGGLTPPGSGSTPADVDLDGVRPRARALLRYLAVHLGTDVHRERLVDELWPGVPAAAGNRSLQVAVSSLRTALGRAGLDPATVLPRRGDAYRLELPAGSAADVRDLQIEIMCADAAAAEGDLPAAVRHRIAALALYRGELLPEDGPVEWVVGERERLAQLAAGTALTLAREQRALGRLPEAISAAQRVVQLDPWSDTAWRLLIDLHEETGDEGAASRCRERHRRIDRELAGTPPDAPPAPHSLPRPREDLHAVHHVRGRDHPHHRVQTVDVDRRRVPHPQPYHQRRGDGTG